MHKSMPHFRSEKDILSIISEGGFDITCTEISAPGGEEWWFIARPSTREEEVPVPAP